MPSQRVTSDNPRGFKTIYRYYDSNRLRTASPRTLLTRTFILMLVSAGITAHAEESLRTDSDQLGLTIKGAVEVCDEDGARQYLSRLICPGGQNPDFKRVRDSTWRNPLPKDISKEDSYRFILSNLNRGPLDPGQPDYHITTEYRVRCGKNKISIYLDTYHCAQQAPTVAPVGFSIKRSTDS